MTTAKFRMTRRSLLKKRVYHVDNDIVENIKIKVANICNIPVKNLTKKNRYREDVLARNMCFYILHVYYKQKSAQIAPYFNRDRTTVLYGINTCLNDLAVIPYYMEKLQEVRDSINIPKLFTETK
jgi:chromosomal replication initiation ATPase DnaA